MPQSQTYKAQTLGNTLATDMMFGGFGELMNDYQADQKISNNLQVLVQCEQIAATQAQSVAAIIAHVQRQIAGFTQQIDRAQASIVAERRNIFEITRRYVQQS